MINPTQSYKQQNGSKIRYYLEPFCGLMKPYDNLVRECYVRWNSIEASLTLFYRKMTDLGFTFDGSDVVCPNSDEAANGYSL